MKLTPIDIKNQKFKKALRGLDPVEVKAYLDYVADEFEHLLQHNQQLEKQVAAFQSELRHYKDVEKTLKQTLYEVKQTSELSKETSKKEAELIKREAQIQASKMLEEAKAEAERIRKEVENLKQQKNSFVTRLKHLLSSQLELIEMLQVDDEQLDVIKEKPVSHFKGRKHGAKNGVRKPVVSKEPEKAEVSKEPDRKEEPEIHLPAKEKPSSDQQAKKNKTQSKKVAKDFFKDIFGEDLDVDDIFDDEK